LTTGEPNKVANKPVGHGLAGFSDFCTYKKTAPMSEAGQKAKYSARADFFRSTPRNGHRQAGLVGPVRAKSGLRRPLQPLIDFLAQHSKVNRLG
jgi:hypothetical protein